MTIQYQDVISLIKLVVESIAKDGAAFSPEAFLSNREVVAKVLAQTKPLSPTQLHAIATERHIEDVCKERDRIEQNLDAARNSHTETVRELRRELTLVIDSQRDDLDWFVPHYEGLKRDYDNIKLLNFSSLTMITLGGVLIGLASFLSQEGPKFSALSAGAVATVYGLWTQGLIVYKSRPANDRPSSRPKTTP